MDKLLVDLVLTGGNHLASALIGQGIDPAFERHTDYWAFLERHGQPWADIFVAWRAIMELSEDERNKHTDSLRFDPPDGVVNGIKRLDPRIDYRNDRTQNTEEK